MKYNYIIVFILLFTFNKTFAQLVVTTAQPAATLASTIAGPGVTTFGATLTCPGVANGTFTSIGTLLAMSSGVVLTNGHAAACAGTEPALTSFNNGTAGDPTFVTLGLLPAGTSTFDACILDFNVVATGDTLSFNYQFGSDEYRTAVCSSFNDAFGFFISGPGIVGTPNIALVPGTNLPVEINSVNNGIPGTSGGANIANCHAVGAGSPFTSYYLDNTGGTLLSYRGYTQKFKAFHVVTPCDTYHLKLSIVDAGNAIYDSGVFIEAASLNVNSYTFNHLAALGATINGIPHSIVKGCSPATVQIVASHASTTATTISLTFGGTAVNGVDVSTVPSSLVLPADSTSVSFNVSGLPTPPGGTKTFTIYISSLCGSSVDSITINVMDTPSARILTPDTTICIGGSFLIRVAGTVGLSYLWTPATGLSSASVIEPTATPTASTIYTMTATLPGSGCPPIIRTLSVNVVNTAITMLTHDTTICSGNSFTILVAGNAINNYSWSPTVGLSNPSIQDPTATPPATTVYTVTATGPGGMCPNTAQLSVTVNSIDANILTPDTTICGTSSFQIRVTGTPGLNYTWSPAAGLSSTIVMQPIASPTVTTTYIMTASSPGSGCPPIVRSITVLIGTTNFNILTPDTTICIGDRVPIRLVGGTGYLYSWNPTSLGLDFYNIQDPTATPTATTTYSVTVSIPDVGCPSSATLTITVITPKAVIITPDTTICHGSNLQLMVDTTGGPFSYHWSPTNDLSNPNIADPILTPTVLTTYTLTTTTLVGGCKAQAEVTINFSGSGSVHFWGSDSVLCRGTGINFIALGSAGSSAIVWYFGDGDSLRDVNPALHAYYEAGTYTVTVAALYAGCPDTVESKVVNIFQQPALDLGNDTSICLGSDPIYLHNRINTGSEHATWYWNTGATTPGIYVSTPGIYYAIVSNYGCKTTDSVWVANDCYMDIPNAFTPNGDGVNDYFFPRQLLTRGLINFKMSIFNRWGELIFVSTSIDGRGWDGNYNNVPQPEGVYIYLIDAIFKDGQKEHHQGNITLLK